MIAAFDVQYEDREATVGCVLFEHWADKVARSEHAITVTAPSDYVPGAFYKRELPCIMEMLAVLDERPGTIVIDGYVWLAHERPGLGQHVFERLNHDVAVIGVAKNTFANNDVAIPLLRGSSQNPLFITASGIDSDQAAKAVEMMDGAFRIPTLLKRCDALARQGQRSGQAGRSCLIWAANRSWPQSS